MHDSRILIGRTIETEQNREVNDKVVKEIQEIHRLILQKFNLLKVAPKLWLLIDIESCIFKNIQNQSDGKVIASFWIR